MEKRVKKMKKVIFFILLFVLCFLLVCNNFINSQSRRRFLETANDLGSDKNNMAAAAAANSHARNPKLVGTVEGWEFNTSRDASLYVLSDNSTILKPRNFCDSSVFLLIVVCSAPANVLNRNAIRATWGSQRLMSGKAINVYFLMGDSYNTTLQKDILEENELHNDIIQDHFVDSYNNLTLKSIVMLKLVSNYCTHSTIFLMKTDDDIFLNMPPLITMLRNSNTSNILVGSLICGAKPIKDTTNKWYSPSYMYNGKVYPNYLSGTGYVMSIDVVPKLYDAALQTPIFHLEDIYITGILSKAISLRPRNNGGFTFQKRKFDPCVFKTAFTSHRLSPTEIHEQYHLLQTLNLQEECRIQEQMKNSSFNIFGYFGISKAKPKKKKISCY